MYLIALLTAFAAGVLMAFQGSLNTGLGKIIGLLAYTFFVHTIGTAAMTILLLIMKGESKAGKLTGVPWYLYLGGILMLLFMPWQPAFPASGWQQPQQPLLSDR